jgi:hypothetical protein
MQNQTKTDLDQTYTVVIKPINDINQKKALQEALDRIETMKQTLDYFHKTILTGYQEATSILVALQKAGILRDEPERQQTDKSVATYLELLHAIKAEMLREQSTLETMKDAKEEQTIEIGEPGAENFDDFVTQKIKNAKVQTKKIESSLRVSFSRYHHWINQTITRLTQIYNLHATPHATKRAQ